MAGEFKHIIDRINAKAEIVLERYALVNRQRREALDRVGELEREIRRLRAENERLRQETEYLKLATTISPSRKDVENMRAVLSELVREIDRCIAELDD